MIDVEARIHAPGGGPTLDVRLGIDASSVRIFEQDTELEVWPIERINLESRQASSFLFEVDGERWVIEPSNAIRFVFDALPLLVAQRNRRGKGIARRLLRYWSSLLSSWRSPAGIDLGRFALPALTSLIWVVVFGVGIMVGRLRLDGRNAITWIALVVVFAGGMVWTLVSTDMSAPGRRDPQSKPRDEALSTVAKLSQAAVESRSSPAAREIGGSQAARWTVRGDPSVLARLLDERATQAPVRSTPPPPNAPSRDGVEPLDEKTRSQAVPVEEHHTTEVGDSVGLFPSAGDLPAPLERDGVDGGLVGLDEPTGAVGESSLPSIDEVSGEEEATLGVAATNVSDHDLEAAERLQEMGQVDTQDDEVGWVRISIEAGAVDRDEGTAGTVATSPGGAASPLSDGADDDRGPGEPSDSAIPPAPPDDLTVLHGIGSFFEAWLNDLGIQSFDDMLAIDEAKEEELRSELGRFAARIFREGWRDDVRQAQAQTKQPVPDAAQSSS